MTSTPGQVHPDGKCHREKTGRCCGGGRVDQQPAKHTEKEKSGGVNRTNMVSKKSNEKMSFQEAQVTTSNPRVGQVK